MRIRVMVKSINGDELEVKARYKFAILSIPARLYDPVVLKGGCDYDMYETEGDAKYIYDQAFKIAQKSVDDLDFRAIAHRGHEK